MSRVLLIEPDRVLAKLYSRALTRMNHEVTVSHQAQDAVFKADARKPDVVVLELQLAGHSGVEFLYEFHSYAEWQNVPVILHTMVPPQALTISEMLMDQLNISAYLYKPATTLEKLLREISGVTATVRI